MLKIDSIQSAAKPGRRHWAVVGLLFLATLLNYLDRQVLSVIEPVLRVEFGMRATDYSRVVFAFLLAYTIMQSVAGRLVDILGARRALALALAWWSISGMLHAAARSTTQLAAFRFLLGVGEAGNWPAAVALIQKLFPPQQRALAVGLFNGGSAIGALVAPPLISWLAIAFSWRVAFLITGLTGLLWLIPWLALRHPPAQPGVAGTNPAKRGAWRELIRTREVWGLMLARFCCDPVWWFYVFWLPDYLNRERGFSLAAIGAVAWLPFLTADLGGVAGGWASGRLIRRGATAISARKAVMGASAALMTGGALAVRVHEAWLAIALVSVVTFAYSCWAANVLTLSADAFPAGSVGAATGLGGTAAGLGGMLTTLAIGWLIDRFSYLPVFTSAAVLPLAAAAAVFVFFNGKRARLEPAV